jgi:hypothetical protein
LGAEPETSIGVLIAHIGVVTEPIIAMAAAKSVLSDGAPSVFVSLSVFGAASALVPASVFDGVSVSAAGTLEVADVSAERRPSAAAASD